ncbi:hypothetical protein [Halovivax cerinus]|uniref:Uncharacterized protein n=1 Tax=Halovivax cerinus TaxID=1487865 RepID=A0ABD5NTB8_9EURY|nr:hypothetical protein [Halovivax cerinus]
MVDGAARSPVFFERADSTVRVGDDIEGAEVRIEIDGEPALEPALPDVFLFPVDEAVSVVASRMRLHETFGQTVWDRDGNRVGLIADGLDDLPRGTYHASITGAVKIHLRFEGAVDTAEEYFDEAGHSIVELRFDEPTSVAIGARSFRSFPSATITVPDEPESLLSALPYLSSSIKEFTCERSWPTLRQHPPAIERGDRLDVPPELRLPETGVEIRVPATYEHCYQVAPLAFYLGADLCVGDVPTLVLENGHVEPLATGRASLSECVGDLLGRCLLLDSLVRKAGYKPMENAEYDQLAPELPFYPPNLYDVPLADQLLEYLEVPHDVLAPYVPRWPKRAVLRPTIADVACLPSLLHELARIDVAPSAERVHPTISDGERGETRRDRNREAQRSAALLTAHTFPEPVSGSCRLYPDAMKRAPTVERPAPDCAHLTLATDDPDRARAFHRFADRIRHETTISVLEAPAASTLREALCADRTALYCELATNGDGIRCSDRRLRFDTLQDVESPVVWLAGAPPGATGDSLVSSGAIAVVLTDDAPDGTTICGTFTQLLAGFSVADAVYTADVDREVAVRFVGDASVTVVRHVCKSPAVFDVSSIGDDRYAFTIRSYPTDVVRQGAAIEPLSPDDVIGRVLAECNHDGNWLVGTDAEQALPITTEEVAALIDDDGFSVRLDGRLVVADDASERDRQEVVRERNPG